MATPFPPSDSASSAVAKYEIAFSPFELKDDDLIRLMRNSKARTSFCRRGPGQSQLDSHHAARGVLSLRPVRRRRIQAGVGSSPTLEHASAREGIGARLDAFCRAERCCNRVGLLRCGQGIDYGVSKLGSRQGPVGARARRRDHRGDMYPVPMRMAGGTWNRSFVPTLCARCAATPRRRGPMTCLSQGRNGRDVLHFRHAHGQRLAETGR